MNYHVEQGYIPKLGFAHSKEAVARAALKNIPGSEQLIAKTFRTKPVPRELPIERPQNLIFHSGVIRH